MNQLERIIRPIGQFDRPASLSSSERTAAITRLANMPAALTEASQGLTSEQLDSPYRPGGWTLRQVIHHIPDSHLNGYIRIKFALTEENPQVKPFDENLWAALGDSTRGEIGVSLRLVTALHERWASLLSSLNDSQFALTYLHPDNGPVRIDVALALYAWHGDHHTGQIAAFRKHMGW